MTPTLLAPAPQPAVPEPAPAPPPLRLERRHWLAALAVLVVFFAPYQTIVQTVLTDDAVRKGLIIDEYDILGPCSAGQPASTISMIAALTDSERLGHAFTTRAKSGGKSWESALD